MLNDTRPEGAPQRVMPDLNVAKETDVEERNTLTRHVWTDCGLRIADYNRLQNASISQPLPLVPEAR